MTKEILEESNKALGFVNELIDYIFEYPDDDYMTMECLCRKLQKHGLIDKKGGEYIADTPQTETQTETQNSNLNFEKTDCEITECDYHKYCKERGQTDCGWK